MVYRYKDRVEAGKVLGRLVKHRAFLSNVVVVALPRGGVPVGFYVAEAVNAPLDVLVVRKIGAPGHTELACGALTLSGEVVWNERIMRSLGVTKEMLQSTVDDELKEAQARELAIRVTETPMIPLQRKSVLLVDDGLATGATMKAAVQSVLALKPAEVIVCIPVAPASSCVELEKMGCSVVCDQRVEERLFSSVGQWYADFPQVSTAECRELLRENRQRLEGEQVAAS